MPAATWRAGRCGTSSTIPRIPTPRPCCARCPACRRTSSVSTRSKASLRHCGTCRRGAGLLLAAPSPTIAAGNIPRCSTPPRTAPLTPPPAGYWNQRVPNTMSATPVLQVRDLKKYFPVTQGFFLKKVVGQVQAVDGINFSIPQGQTLAIVGESGCGKTTTAKLVLRLEDPTSGQVLADGKDVHALSGEAWREYRTAVQAVFQDPWSSLNPRMRVRQIVAETLVVNQKISDQEVKDRVAEALASVGLRPQQADLYPHEFSGGQRQRIAVASALVSKPKLIVLDEPVSALDVSIRAQIMNLLVDLQKQYDVSYLLIARHLATTRYMANEVAVMYLGKIVEKAKTKELFSNPLHPYTKALFSAALPSHPDVTHDEIILTGEVPSPINPPSGCRFHTRCPFAMAKCSEEAPPLREIAPGHLAACHLIRSEERRVGKECRS